MDIAKINSKKKIPPKIKLLMDSPYIDDVNKMIDVGTYISDIKRFLESKDFTISRQYISFYKNIRKNLAAEEENVDKFIQKSPVSKLIEDQEKSLKEGSSASKLKNDLEFLDMVIQTGTDQLKTMIANNDYMISIQEVFKAIELKDKLTDGALEGYTDFGIKNLQQMTENKYIELLEYMFKYIPEEDRSKLLNELEEVEEEYYKSTDYYEYYLRNIGKSEAEIQRKLKELEDEGD